MALMARSRYAAFTSNDLTRRHRLLFLPKAANAYDLRASHEEDVAPQLRQSAVMPRAADVRDVCQV